MEQPGKPFRFDLAELRPPPLRLVEPELVPLPAAAAAVSGPPAPGWLPRLLPVFRSGAPLLVRIPHVASPVFAARLRDSLAALIASAGAGCGVLVVTWADGFAVGVRSLRGVPREPQVTLVGADLEPASIRAASLEVERAGPGGWFVLNGAEPALDAALGLPTDAGRPGAAVLHRLPMIGSAEVSGLVRGLPAGLSTPRFGLACAALARAVVARYRELEP